MAKTYPTLWFNESMQGAAQTGDSDAGAMIAILKACLVDGFGSLVPDSIVWDETKALAKASFSAGHSYLKDSVIACSGSAVADYNGKHRIIEITSTEIYFELDTVPVAAASGSLEIKIAPLGWEITHSNGTNDILIFRPKGNLGAVSLRVDNTAWDGWYDSSTTKACHMKVEMVEDVSDIDTYQSIFEHHWPATGNLSDHKWDLVGDGRMIFLLPEYGQGKKQSCFVAGYIDSIRAGDEYHFIMNHLTTTTVNSSSNEWDSTDNIYNNFAKNKSVSYNVIARKYHQLEGTDSWLKSGVGENGSDTMPMPNPVDNGFYLNTQPIMIQESDLSFRGYMPMLIEPLAEYSALFRKNISDFPELDGKTYRFLRSTKSNSYNLDEVLIGFDISSVEV